MRAVVVAALLLCGTLAGCLANDPVDPSQEDTGGETTGTRPAGSGAEGSGGSGQQPSVIDEATVTVERLRLNVTGAAGDAVFIWIPIQNATQDELLRYSTSFESGDGAEVLVMLPIMAWNDDEGVLQPGQGYLRAWATDYVFTNNRALRDNDVGLWAMFASDKAWTLQLLLRIDPALDGPAQPNSTIGEAVISHQAGFHVIEHLGNLPGGAEPAGTVTITEEVEAPALLYTTFDTWLSLVSSPVSVRQFTQTYPSGTTSGGAPVACASAFVTGVCTEYQRFIGGELSSATGSYSLELTHVDPNLHFRIRVYEVPISFDGLPAVFDGLRLW